MTELIGIPAWVFVVALLVVVILAVYIWRTGGAQVIEVALDSFDDSPVDYYITDLIKTLSPAQKQALKDVAEILSPLTERTPNDLDDKTLKILEDWVAARNG